MLSFDPLCTFRIDKTSAEIKPATLQDKKDLETMFHNQDKEDLKKIFYAINFVSNQLLGKQTPNQKLIDYCIDQSNLERKKINQRNGLISTVIGIAAGAFASYSRSWGLLGTLSAFLGAKIVSWASLSILEGHRVLSNPHSYDNIGISLICSPEFTEFAKEHNMLDAARIVEAHGLYQNKLAQDAAAVKAKIAAPAA
jgi:hypothetical protein